MSLSIDAINSCTTKATDVEALALTSESSSKKTTQFVWQSAIFSSPKPVVLFSADRLVQLEPKKFSYGKNADDPHTKTLKQQIEFVKGFSLQRKLIILDVIDKIQKFVDKNRYSEHAREVLIRDLDGAYESCSILMEDPTTNSFDWIFVENFSKKIFVDEIAHFAQLQSNTLSIRFTYTSEINTIISEIDPIFTRERIKLWNLFLQADGALSVAKKVHSNEKLKQRYQNAVKNLIKDEDIPVIIEMWVAKNGNPETLKILEINCNFKDANGCPLLVHYVKQGNEVMVKMLIAAGADLNAQAEDGSTALMVALDETHQNSEIAQVLFRAKPDVNIKDSKGKTALMRASLRGNLTGVKKLIAAGADLNAQTIAGFTALMYAVDESRLIPEIADELLRAKPEIDMKDNRGKTALIWASLKGSLTGVKVLIAADADINAQDKNGSNALMFAVDASYSNPDIADEILRAKPDVNAKDETGNTALIRASLKGNFTGVKKLIGAGADVNAKNNAGYTALMFAVDESCQNSEIVDELLGVKPDVNAKDLIGGTALTPASSKGNLDGVKILIATGAEVNAKTKSGYTALMFAIDESRQNSDIADELLRAKPDVNAKDETGSTALIRASSKGNPNGVKILIAAGADVNAQTKSGETALISASRKGYSSVVKILVAAGADRDITDLKGKTARMYAAEGRDFEIMIELLHDNPNVKDALTPLLVQRSTLLESAQTL